MPAVVLAQDATPPQVHYPKLPIHATAADGFAPPGWRVELTATGDLDGDGIGDLALVLRERDAANVLKSADAGPPGFDTNPRILAVALGRRGGGYDLAVEDHTLIPRNTEPTIDDYLDGGGIAIAHETLRVELHLFASAGGWTAGKKIYTFRFRRRRLVLIGYESEMVQRNTGEVTGIGIDYLAGKMKRSTGTIDNDRDKVTWKTVPHRPLLTIDRIGNGIDFDPAAK
jgi:hypothetical protein